MPFYVTYDSDNDCVVTMIEGILDKEVVLAFFKEVGSVAGKNNCTRILSDLRNAKIVAPVSDIYAMAKLLDSMNISPSFRRAIVITTDHDDYRFWETACYNQGHSSVRLFENYERAKKWVLEK